MSASTLACRCPNVVITPSVIDTLETSLTVVVVILIAQTIVLAKCGLYVEATVARHSSHSD